MARRQAQVIPEKGLALDANIPIRAALGKRVHELLRAYEGLGRLLHSSCFGDARKYIP